MSAISPVRFVLHFGVLRDWSHTDLVAVFDVDAFRYGIASGATNMLTNNIFNLSSCCLLWHYSMLRSHCRSNCCTFTYRVPKLRCNFSITFDNAFGIQTVRLHRVGFKSRHVVQEKDWLGWMMQYDTQINNRIKNIQTLFEINWSNKI